MRKMWLVIGLVWALGLLAITRCAHAGEFERYEGAWQFGNVIDMTQTIRAVGQHPQCYTEHGMNALVLDHPVFGPHPSSRQIATYNLSYAAVHYAVTWLLIRGDPGPIRKWFARSWHSYTHEQLWRAIEGNTEAAHMFIADRCP